MRTEAAVCAARAPKNPPVRPAGGRFVRLGLHLIVLRLCCSTACELRTVLRSHDERSTVPSSQAAEQYKPERDQVQPEPHEARSGRPDWPRRLAGASESRGPCSWLPAACGGESCLLMSTWRCPDLVRLVKPGAERCAGASRPSRAPSRGSAG